MIRIFLVGLPAGVMLLGIGTILWTHLIGGSDAEAEKEAGMRNRAAELMRKPVSRDDLEAYVEVLSKEIGERNPEDYDKLRAAAFWIESTIGPNNMGYAVERQKFEMGGKEVWNVVATLPGRQENAGVVVVGTRYDTAAGGADAKEVDPAVAGMLALANAFSGADNERTVTFVAFAEGTPAGGRRIFFEDCESRGVKIAETVDLGRPGVFHSTREGGIDFEKLAAEVKGWERSIDNLANPSRAEP